MVGIVIISHSIFAEALEKASEMILVNMIIFEQ